ncbi:zinc finger CCCH domain-containing protein 3 isoform X1 [Gorilla gorilla gorilla]|uniref:zinc finger CCCH domain-containing protein 3 isoform X1 n=1 Tax=Gorilla gorilla gorilla TaxID=9595 RepID=UPI00300ACF90
MEEKEILRRQIRLLQGLIDDYKTLHGNAPAPGTPATSGWQPPTYHSGRVFSARYPRPSRRGYSSHHGPSWRKKYSLVNRPPGPSDPPADHAVRPLHEARGCQAPVPQQHVLEGQVQLSQGQNVVIKVKPPSKSGSASASGAQRGSLEEYEDTPWSDQRPREGEGEPPWGQLQPSRPTRARGTCSVEDPLLVCQKEPGKPRMVKSVGSVGDSPREPRRTVSESVIAVKASFPSSPLPPRTGVALGRKLGSHSVASCAPQLLGDRRVDAGHTDQPVPSGSVGGPARPASGPRQAREASLVVTCRTNKFRKNNYKWVAASAKSPRAARRALSPRVAAENVCKASAGMANKVEKPQLIADPEPKPRKPATSSKPGSAPSKYKWKASSPSASSSSSFRWQSEAGSKDHASQLSPVLSRSPSGDRPAVGHSGLKPLSGETPLSAYKVKSRTKIIRRRGSTSLPGDKKSSTSPATTTKSHLSLRRRQALRGKSSPVLKKTPNKGLVQVTTHRLCRLPPSRAHLPTKEASSLHAVRTAPTSKVIKTRYRIVKKTPASPLSAPPFPLSLPSWRARRLSLSRSLVLNRLRPVASGGGKAQPGSPRWRSKGYRCIGGVLYKVSANKLSKTSGQPSDAGSRPLLRTGRLDPAGSCSRSLASRAVQRSLAIIRQARQRREKRKEYCMYYNRFGRCNRGERCPYIHDPEKVAVCTRFVRGTCKKTDGTCPFSHHVSKEKVVVAALPACWCRVSISLSGGAVGGSPATVSGPWRVAACWPSLPALPADAGVLLLPEGHLQQQQLSLQPRVCVPQGRGLQRLPQRLLPPGCKVQEETHAAVPRLRPQGGVSPRRPVPAAPPYPETPQSAGSHVPHPRAQRRNRQEQGLGQPRAQEAFSSPAPHQADAQLPCPHCGCPGCTSPLPRGVSLSLILEGFFLLLIPSRFLGPRGTISPGGRLSSSMLQQALQAAFLHLPAVLAKPRSPAQGPGPQGPPHQGLREASAHQTTSVRTPGTGLHLPQTLILGEERGSVHHSTPQEGRPPPSLTWGPQGHCSACLALNLP